MTAAYCAQCANFDVCCARQVCVAEQPARTLPAKQPAPSRLSDVCGIALCLLAVGVPVARLLMMVGQ